MAPIYGLAEQAADLIRKEHNNVPNNSTPSTTTPQAKSEASHGIFSPSFAFFAFIIGFELHLLIAL
jgi:hypothetical protein